MKKIVDRILEFINEKNCLSETYLKIVLDTGFNISNSVLPKSISLEIFDSMFYLSGPYKDTIEIIDDYKLKNFIYLFNKTKLFNNVTQEDIISIIGTNYYKRYKTSWHKRLLNKLIYKK